MATVTDDQAPQALLMQLLDPACRADPYPSYNRIRELGPRLRLTVGHQGARA
ncbi:hypothetical protein [Mycolicibacterium lutetiense]